MSFQRKLGITFSAVFSLWFISGFAVSRYLPKWFKTRIESSKKLEISIGNSRTNFFNSISLFNIDITGPVEVNIPQVTIAFRPWRFFSTTHVIFIDLIEPELIIPNQPDNHGLLSKPMTPLWLRTRFDIQGGSLQMAINRKNFNLTSLSGHVDMGPLGISGELKSKGPNEIDINGKFNLKPSSEKGDWSANFFIENFALSTLPQLSNHNLNGKCSIETTLKGISIGKTKINNWTINASGKNSSWKRWSNSPPILFKFQLMMDPHNLNLTSVETSNGIKISGSILSPWKTPQLDLSVSSIQSPLQETLPALIPRYSWNGVEGTATFSSTIKGSVDQPTISGSYLINSNYLKFNFPPIEGTWNYHQGKLNSTAHFSGGRILIEQSDLESEKDFILTLDRISMKNWGDVNGWDNVDGLASAKLLFDQYQNDFSLSGDFSFNQLKWGRLSSTQTHQGFATLNKNAVYLKTQDNLFVLKTELHDGKMKINDFLLKFGGNSEFLGHGAIDISAKEVNLNMEGKKIPPDLWPPLVSRYPDIQGEMNFTGEFNGKTSNLEAKLDVRFDHLKFIEEGEYWKGKTQLIGNKNGFSLQNLEIDGGYSGSLSWLGQKKGEGQWSFESRFLRAKPELIRDVLKSTVPVDGFIDGQIQMTWSNNTAIGISSITWNKGAWGDFWFDQIKLEANASSQKVKLNQLSVIKGPKAIRAEAIGLTEKDGWRFDTVFQLQQWGISPFVLDGEFQSEGKIYRDFTLNGKIRAPIVWIQDNSFEAVEAEIKRTSKSWHLKGQGQENFSFNLIAERNTSKLEGTAKGSSFRFENLLGSLLPHSHRPTLPKGNLDFSAHFSGNVSAPILLFKGNLSDGIWKDTHFDAETSFVVSPSSFVIAPSKIDFRNGGHLTIEGNIDKEAAYRFQLKGNGTSIPLNNFFNLLGWNLRWDGQTDLQYEINADKDQKSFLISLDGKHQRLGPFKNGGPIKGTITGNQKEIGLDGLKVESGNGYLKFLKGSRLFLERNGAGTMRLMVESRNLNASALSIFGNVELTGQWGARSETEPQKSRPVELDVFARSLWLNQYHLDGNLAHVTIEKGHCIFSPIPGSGQQVSGEMIFDAFPTLHMNRFQLVENGTQKILLDGHIGSDKWDFQLKLNNIDANLVRGAFNTTIPVSGPMKVSLWGRGTPFQPDIIADVHWMDGTINRIPFDTASSHLRYKDHILTLENLVVQKKKGFQLNGYIQTDMKEIENKHPLTINLKIEKGDFSILKEIFPSITDAQGTFEGYVNVGSKSGNRFTEGRLQGEKIELRSEYAPILKKGVFDIHITDEKLKIDRASAVLGEGTAVLSGDIDFLDGAPHQYNLHLISLGRNGLLLKAPQLAIPPGPVLGRLGLIKKKLTGISRGEPKIDLKLLGLSSAPVLSGVIELRNTVFTYPPNKVKRTSLEEGPTLKWLTSMRDRIFWDLNLTAGSRTWYQNELVDAAVAGNLKIKGKKGALSVDGRISTEQGAIVYSGNEFKIKEAVIDIETSESSISTDENINKTYVYLKANAEKEVFYSDALSNNNQDTIVMLVDRALIGEIQPRFLSRNNPNLSSERAFQLAMGLPFNGSVEDNLLLPDQRAEERNKTKEETDKLLRIGLVQLLDSSLASPLARALAQHTGLVDFIRVTYQEKDPLSDGPFIEEDASSTNDITQNEFLKYAKGTKVRFGRGLSKRLFADYSFRVDEFQEKLDLRHEVELAYRLRQSFYLRGITELDSERTLGRPPDRRAILENQWRFGLPKRKSQTN